MKLIDVTKRFVNDEQCLDYIEQMRWPNGICCVHCGVLNVSKITREKKGKNQRTRIYPCLEKECGKQFSATSGTIFNDSHLPLTKWFLAIALICEAKKGMSACQLQRHLGCNYRTAWYLAHRIREAMQDPNAPKLKGVIVIDETYLGGRHRSNWRRLRKKDVVMGIRERGGDLRLIHIEDNTSQDLGKQIRKHVAP